MENTLQIDEEISAEDYHIDKMLDIVCKGSNNCKLCQPIIPITSEAVLRFHYRFRHTPEILAAFDNASGKRRKRSGKSFENEYE